MDEDLKKLNEAIKLLRSVETNMPKVVERLENSKYFLNGAIRYVEQELESPPPVGNDNITNRHYEKIKRKIYRFDQ